MAINKNKHNKSLKIILKNGNNLKDLQDLNIKWNNIFLIGIPEGEEREREEQNFFEKKQWLKTSLT